MCVGLCVGLLHTPSGGLHHHPRNSQIFHKISHFVNVESQFRDEERMQRALVAGDHMYRIGRRMSVRGSSQFVREKALNDEETLGYGGATSRRSKGSTDRIIKNSDPKLGI